MFPAEEKTKIIVTFILPMQPDATTPEYHQVLLSNFGELQKQHLHKSTKATIWKTAVCNYPSTSQICLRKFKVAVR